MKRRARNLNTDDRQTNNETIKLAGSRTNARSKYHIIDTQWYARFAFSLNYIPASRPMRNVSSITVCNHQLTTRHGNYISRLRLYDSVLQAP